MSDAVEDARHMGIEIDDPIDMENALLRQWLHHQPSFHLGTKQYVLGARVLPPRWAQLTEEFTTEEHAEQFLRRSFHTHSEIVNFRRLAREIGSVEWRPSSDQQLFELVALALVTGRAWIISPRKSPPVAKASPQVFASANAAFGTRVDFSFLAKWEGGQCLHGYVPIAKGKVAGNSGMTIATGFDIGQKSAAAIRKLNLGKDLEDQLIPFADHKFPGMAHLQVVNAVIQLHAPVPRISKGQADLIDGLVHREHLAAAVSAWNSNRKNGVPAFSKLPVPWQTVLFSRTFHQGVGMHKTSIARKFYNAATAGEWTKAVRELRNYPVSAGWYKQRVAQEADYLATELPPAPKSPVANPSPRPNTIP
jgi:hypothetical protein